MVYQPWCVMGNWFTPLFALVLGKVSLAKISAWPAEACQVPTLHVDFVPKHVLHRAPLLRCDPPPLPQPRSRVPAAPLLVQ